MNTKLPYYMAYPMPLAYDDEKIERRDFEYLKSLYPATAKKILPYVEEECDRMEYEHSMMYDEYPDRLQLRLMCSRICNKARNQEMPKEEFPEWVNDLVEVMLYQELYKRRCDNRKVRRRFY